MIQKNISGTYQLNYLSYLFKLIYKLLCVNFELNLQGKIKFQTVKKFDKILTKVHSQLNQARINTTCY